MNAQTLSNRNRAAHIGMRGASVTLMLGVLLTTGCASSMPNAARGPLDARPTPEIVVVRAFDVSPDQCARGDRHAQLQTYGAMPNADVAPCATRLSHDVADEIARQLQAKGWTVLRSDTAAPRGTNALLVEGSFETIDAGNARRRIVVGLGAGKRELAAAVKLTYQPAAGSVVPVQSFTAKAQSGKAPGMAESGAIGAITHRIPVALAASAALHLASEARHSTGDADAKKLAASIVKEVDAASVTNRWDPREQTRVGAQ